VLYALTVYGTGSGFEGEDYLFGGQADEGEDATFWTDLAGPDPVSYQWFVQYPWTTNMVLMAGATNSALTFTNVDSWVNGYVDAQDVFHGTQVACLVTNGIGESLYLGPEYLTVDPVRVDIPPTNYANSEGPASRYPMTIDVFGMPTNFDNVSITVTLWGFNHTRSADVGILLVSPSGKGITLMSNVGGANGVSHADLLFQDGWSLPTEADPLQTPGPSPWPRELGPSNYGQVSQMPQVGQDPPPLHAGVYSDSLLDLRYDDPNGGWKLYIYDSVLGASGHLDSSWQLHFYFQ